MQVGRVGEGGLDAKADTTGLDLSLSMIKLIEHQAR